MQKCIRLLRKECPEESAEIAEYLDSIDLVLNKSIERVKAAMNLAIDQRQLHKLEELQGVLVAIARMQEELRRYVQTLREPDQETQDECAEATAVSLETEKTRRRGAIVRVDGKLLKVGSVKELFSTTFTELDSKGILEKLLPLIPFATSSKRYLIAWKPVHPSGRSFFAPLEYEGIFLETNQSYKTAVSALKKLLAEIDIRLELVSRGP